MNNNKDYKVLIGADPELFIEKDGEIISAEGLVGGSKEEPMYISDEGHALQEDNVMVEYNIPPAKTLQEFVQHNNFVLNYLKEKFEKDGITINTSVSANLNNKYLKSKQAKTFGCEPDFNIYSRNANTPPSSKSKLRCCGGHIHIGLPNRFCETDHTIEITKLLDATLGLLSVLKDDDNERRSMYGRAGSVRFKNYGFEYRTLSNFWIHDRELMEEVYLTAILVTKLYMKGLLKFEDLNICSSEIERVINTSDVSLAEILLDQVGKKLTSIAEENEDVESILLGEEKELVKTN
jgi:hypothetical protein